MSAISSGTFVSSTELLFFQNESLQSTYELPLLHVLYAYVLLYSITLGKKSNKLIWNIAIRNGRGGGGARPPRAVTTI